MSIRSHPTDERPNVRIPYLWCKMMSGGNWNATKSVSTKQAKQPKVLSAGYQELIRIPSDRNGAVTPIEARQDSLCCEDQQRRTLRTNSRFISSAWSQKSDGVHSNWKNFGQLQTYELKEVHKQNRLHCVADTVWRPGVQAKESSKSLPRWRVKVLYSFGLCWTGKVGFAHASR